jgi:hypothetical protein
MKELNKEIARLRRFPEEAELGKAIPVCPSV